jgi:hypothetical protein
MEDRIMEQQELFTLAFAVACLLGFLAVRRKPQGFTEEDILRQIQGTCYISAVENRGKRGVKVAFKNNTRKYWLTIPPGHSCFGFLCQARERFVNVTSAGGRFELSSTIVKLHPGFDDALEQQLKFCRAELLRAAADGTLAYHQRLAELVLVKLPLEQERVLSALAVWRGLLRPSTPVWAELSRHDAIMRQRKAALWIWRRSQRSH